MSILLLRKHVYRRCFRRKSSVFHRLTMVDELLCFFISFPILLVDNLLITIDFEGKKKNDTFVMSISKKNFILTDILMELRKLIFFSAVAAALFFTSCGTQKKFVHKEEDPYHPKREFRGAWIHTVAQPQYAQMNSDQMKTYFVRMLDQLQAAGINAVVFQVRPQADAFYKSAFEPWSRYLTGVQGKAPDNGFDPLAFMIQECHKRCMELHAWLNPYRVGSESQTLVQNHIYNQHPERFVKYGSQIYFDPGVPENRNFICQVVRDIVMHYDVDAIHMDDYFYPYPIAGQKFPDDASFDRYGASQGFSSSQRGDWRRNNVNLLIGEIKQTLLQSKPWVRFGISPFGIYRNKRSTSDGSGSETNGLQNYDDLYADIKLWVKKGWIDYNVPQVYWEIGHPKADYATLVGWWAKNNYGRHLYIGQDVKRTMDKTDAKGESQLREKMNLSRSSEAIHGNCFWPGYTLMENYKGITSELITNYNKYPSLIPAYSEMRSKAPKKVDQLEEYFTADKHFLRWSVKTDRSDPTQAQYFVVYRFSKNVDENMNLARNIVKITRDTQLELPYEGGRTNYKYVVTAVDAFHNESKGKSLKLKL